MIELIKFQNFKALRQTTLPLSRFTLIVGPNGSGKTTALSAVLTINSGSLDDPQHVRTAGLGTAEPIIVRAQWKEPNNDWIAQLTWMHQRGWAREFHPSGKSHSGSDALNRALSRARLFALDASLVAAPVHLRPNMELEASGRNLAGVLDRLRDQNPERFDALNQELGRWIPEFDKILFETPHEGHRSIALRTREGKHSIRATEISQGTLIALALLTIAYLPEPPSIVCLEEPDHGLHPRLLRDVKDALYRLAFPEGSGEKREPVQVIATTHNPYFLDLFKEHPEQIVIAEKVGLEAKFSRLSDREDLEEILGDAPLSEVWYSGVLGGVPAGT